MIPVKIDSFYSQEEICYLLDVLLDIRLLTKEIIDANRKFYKELSIDFFSINNILAPASTSYFSINNEELSSFRYDGNLVGAYSYVTSVLVRNSALSEAKISFSIKDYDAKQFLLTLTHAKGVSSLVFSGYTEYIIGATNFLNSIIALNNIPLVCLPLTVAESDCFVFVEQNVSFKIIHERILKVTGITYPEIESWIASRSSEPFAF